MGRMAIAFKCPCCSHTRSYSDAALGRKVRCDMCKAKIRIHSIDKFWVIDPPPAAPVAEEIQTCTICDIGFPATPDGAGRVKCPKCGSTFEGK